jgi:hypothetical protein
LISLICSFVQEGAWCHSEENCKQRSKTNLGSSKFMKPQKFDGILSNSEQVNPGLRVYLCCHLGHLDVPSFQLTNECLVSWTFSKLLIQNEQNAIVLCW